MEKKEGYSNIVLDKALAGSSLGGRDRALASTIFYGTLERRLTLDYYLHHCFKQPGKRVEPLAMWALRSAAYQILFLDRIPAPAAVNETVDAVKALGQPHLAGFVNGVLRGLLRRKGDITLPTGQDVRGLSLRYSVPEDLIRLWQESYGDDLTRKLLDSMMERPKTFIRLNTAKGDATQLKARLETEGVKLAALQKLEYAAVIENCGTPTELTAFKDGLFHVQDLSAQLVCRLLSPQPGERICDCCAAPGGKTFTLAQGAAGGKVYAADLYESRVRLIRSGSKRLGLENVVPLVHDATKEFEKIPQVDKMLCDVPCSGFGVIRRKPEIRYRDLDTIKGLPSLQYAILRQASQKVRPGGMLVYATCTLNPAENEQVAARFLKENNGFTPIKIELGLEHWHHEPDYMLTMAPFSGASDGFFAAAFRKL